MPHITATITNVSTMLCVSEAQFSSPLTGFVAQGRPSTSPNECDQWLSSSRQCNQVCSVLFALLDLHKCPQESPCALDSSRNSCCGVCCCVAEPVEPQQVVVQDDLDQLLDMLPADLGGLLINHPKRPQLIEVSNLRVGTFFRLPFVRASCSVQVLQGSAEKQQQSRFHWNLHIHLQQQDT